MIYAFNEIPDKNKKEILNSLKSEGLARFGWSYNESMNLEKYPESGREYGTGFLLGIKEGDHIVYINLPEYGKCVCVKVTGGYKWREPMSADFNHCIPVDSKSLISFGRNDNTVSPLLSSRLKLQGKYWRIYCEEDFCRFLESHKDGVSVAERTIDDNIKFFLKDAGNLLSDKLQKTHPNFDLEALMEFVFKKSGKYTRVERKRGKGDRGADIILKSAPFEYAPYESCCLVQIKSYSDIMKTEKAVDDIKKAFKYYTENKDEKIKPDCALIVTTATEVGSDIRIKIDELSKDNIPIELLYGGELVRFVLRHILDGDDNRKA